MDLTLQFTVVERRDRIKMNYTYILRCCDGTLYTGWTNNLEKRVETHNAGRGGKYTHSRTPVELVYYETFETKQEAMSREAAIKKMSRKAKLTLINQKELIGKMDLMNK